MKRFLTAEKLACLAALVVVTSASPALASVGITFGSPTDVSSASNVIAPGPYTSQIGYDFNGAGSLTIFGVPFVNSPSSLSSGTNNGTYNSTFAGNYGTMLTNGMYSDSSTPSTLTLSVTAGTSYEVGVWIYDDRGCCQGRSDVVTGVGAGGSSATIDFGGGSGTAGQFVWGTFTADGTGLETLQFAPGSSNQQVDGIVIATQNPTPEPTSVVIWGLAIGTGVLVARRRRKA